MLKRLALVVLVFVLSSLAVFAQENDPFTDENANACTEGGSMEGQCNRDLDNNGTVDASEVEWAWRCGWYIIRYEAGMINRVPSDCASQLLDCFINPLFGLSVEFYGNPNNPGNVRAFFGLGCGGSQHIDFLNSMVILAGSLDEAAAICEPYSSVFFVAEIRDLGYGARAGVYGCDYFP